MTTTGSTPPAKAPARRVPARRPSVEEAPAQEAPAQEAPAQEAPVQEAPVQEARLPFSGLPIGHGALLRAIRKNTVRVELPVVGEMRLPPGDTLAWLGGLAALAVVGVLDWPVAAVIGAGHVLAHQNHLRLLKDFGEGLEQL